MKLLITTFSLCLLFLASNAQIVTNLPYFTGFEGKNGNLNDSFPSGWKSEKSTSSYGWQIIKNSTSYINAHTDSTAIHTFSGLSDPNNEWIFTPGFRLQANKTYTLSFWYKNSPMGSTVEKLKVHVGLNQTKNNMSTSPIWNNANITNTTYLKASIYYTPIADTVYYFGFHSYSDPMMFILLIDDVKLEVSPNQNIAENYTENFLSIFPNPATNNFYIVLSENLEENSTLKIFSMDGRLVKTELLLKNSLTSTIDCSMLESGLYFIRLEESKTGKSTTKYFIKNQ